MRNPFAFRSKITKVSMQGHDADILTQGKIVLQELETEQDKNILTKDKAEKS